MQRVTPPRGMASVGPQVRAGLWVVGDFRGLPLPLPFLACPHGPLAFLELRRWHAAPTQLSRWPEPAPHEHVRPSETPQLYPCRPLPSFGGWIRWGDPEPTAWMLFIPLLGGEIGPKDGERRLAGDRV